jgi:Na+-transporting methylmalonyl-CoA/oxaloacetate decarboxylase gamma subunit
MWALSFLIIIIFAISFVAMFLRKNNETYINLDEYGGNRARPKRDDNNSLITIIASLVAAGKIK